MKFRALYQLSRPDMLEYYRFFLNTRYLFYMEEIAGLLEKVSNALAHSMTKSK